MYVYMLIMYNMEGVSFLIIDEHIIDNANVCVCACERFTSSYNT